MAWDFLWQTGMLVAAIVGGYFVVDVAWLRWRARARLPETADGAQTRTRGATVPGGDFAAGANTLAGLDQTERLLSVGLAHADTDRILIERGADQAGGARGAHSQAGAVAGARLYKFHHDGRLALTFPEAASPDVGRGGNVEGDGLLDTPRQPIGIHGGFGGTRRLTAAPREPRQPAADEQGHAAGGGSGAGEPASSSSAHEDSLHEAWRGRNVMRSWVRIIHGYRFIELETVWLSALCTVADALGSRFTRGADGHWRARLADDDVRRLPELLKRIGHAINIERLGADLE